MLTLLDRVNAFDQPEFQMRLNGTLNGAVKVLSWLIKTQLDATRSALNLGCYTARDLRYLLPICETIQKPIECVDSWAPVDTQIKQQLCREIEAQWTSPLITWTWRDAHEATTLQSADYTYFSTDRTFPIENYMRLNHPAVWASSGTPWLWPRLASLIQSQQIYCLFNAPSITLWSNDLAHREALVQAVPQLNVEIESLQQRLEDRETLVQLIDLHQKGGMTRQWQYINSLMPTGN